MEDTVLHYIEILISIETKPDETFFNISVFDRWVFKTKFTWKHLCQNLLFFNKVEAHASNMQIEENNKLLQNDQKSVDTLNYFFKNALSN